MIYLLATILCSSLLFVTFRMFKKFGIDNTQAITMNYLVGALAGYIYYFDEFSFAGIIEAPWLFMAIIEGVLFIAVFYVFAISSQKAGVAVTAVASKMSVVIPVVAGILLYNESASLFKILGLVAALLAFYLTFKNNKQSTSYSRFFLLPLLLFLGNGSVDAGLKYAEHNYVGNETAIFLSTIFLIAFIIGLFITLLKLPQPNGKIRAKNLAGGFVLGTLNYATTLFIMFALGYMESSVIFPIINAGIVSLTALIGFLVFSEKLKPINILGIILALIAIFVIAMS
jgi:drug/metabolite transporter (DMT)-like permease